LQHAFPMDVLMVPSSALAVSADSEHLTCDGFSHSETILLRSLEFIADRIGGLSLSPRGSDSDSALMVSTWGGSPSLLWAMIEDSTEEFSTVSSGEEGSGSTSNRRHSTGALPAPVVTTPWLESALATQAMATVPTWVPAPCSNTGLPLE
jgi:hypothetical protein